MTSDVQKTAKLKRKWQIVLNENNILTTLI